MATDFSRSLLFLILNPDVTLGSVIKLFANYLGAHHYLLVEKPTPNSDPFIVTSNLLGVHIPVKSIIRSFNGPCLDLLHPPFIFEGFDDVRQILSFPVDDDLLIVVINPKSATPENDVLISTQLAVRRLRSICPFDIQFALSTIRNFTENDLSAFSLTTSHPSMLLLITVAYFVQTGLCDALGIDIRNLFMFLLSVRSQYNNVPYHNWFHALDVAHFVYALYTIARFDRFLTDLEMFSLFLAAVCHDADHDGFNNTFHRNASTRLARLAPNLPPLEHHHCCISCNLTRPLLAILPDQDRTTITNFMIECIMATDMEKHQEYIEKWSTVLGQFDRANPSHRLLLAKIIIKAADLSNVAQKFDESERMSKLFIIETHRQGRIEIELGMPVSPMCNPNDDTPLCVGQVGFYAFVAGPLMKQLLAFFPEIEASVKQFEANLARWRETKAAWEAANQIHALLG
jgi:hypothetical protein